MTNTRLKILTIKKLRHMKDLIKAHEISISIEKNNLHKLYRYKALQLAETLMVFIIPSMMMIIVYNNSIKKK
jgi:mannose/fructose/N-acetylgalactosamine-specific phosphotransferase system component IIC